MGFTNQAQLVPLAFQAPKGILETLAMFIGDYLVQMVIRVTQEPLVIRAHLAPQKTELTGSPRVSQE